MQKDNKDVPDYAKELTNKLITTCNEYLQSLRDNQSLEVTNYDTAMVALQALINASCNTLIAVSAGAHMVGAAHFCEAIAFWMENFEKDRGRSKH